MSEFKYRTFLNPVSGLASAEINTSFSNERSFSGSVDITDCSRRIMLDFDVYVVETPKEEREKLINERIQKCDYLIAVFERMKYELNQFKDQPTNSTGSGS